MSRAWGSSSLYNTVARSCFRVTNPLFRIQCLVRNEMPFYIFTGVVKCQVNKHLTFSREDSCPVNSKWNLIRYRNLLLYSRDSGNNFVHFSVPFLEGRISDICAACNYPTRNAIFKSRISDIRLKSVSFLVFHFLCRSYSYNTTRSN